MFEEEHKNMLNVEKR